MIHHELRPSEGSDKETGYRYNGWVCTCGFATEDPFEAEEHCDTFHGTWDE